MLAPRSAALAPARRLYHSTAPAQSAAFLMGCVGVAGVCYTIDYGIKAWEQHKETRAAASSNAAHEASGDGDGAENEKGGSSSSSGGFGSSFYAKRFYDGPFEEEMTRREAALILGVRESASATRIKNAHRKLLILNHPDTGGSTFLATKLNEAKELLLKTATDD